MAVRFGRPERRQSQCGSTHGQWPTRATALAIVSLSTSSALGAPPSSPPEDTVTVEGNKPEVRIDFARKASTARVPVNVTITGGDEPVIAPKLRVHRGEQVELLVLEEDPEDTTHTKYKAMLNYPDEVTRVEVIDADGNELGHVETPESAPRGAPRPEPDNRSRIGPAAPPFSLSPMGPPLWWAPAAEAGGDVGVIVAGDADDGPVDVTGRVLTTAAIGPVGLDLGLRADGFLARRLSDPSGWVGARVRVMGKKKGSFEFAPGVRVGFPITKISRPARLEGGVAFGMDLGRASWLVDVGTRFQLEVNGVGAFAMPFEAVGGITFDATSYLRVYGMLDAEVGLDTTEKPCAICEANQPIPLGGFSLGAELGTTVYGGIAGRVSPFSATFGNFEAMAMIGVRAE
jgi:hypothetical protein